MNVSISRRNLLASTLAMAVASAFRIDLLAQSAPVDGSAVWNLVPLYPNADAWNEARQGVLTALPGLNAYKGSLGQSPERLIAAYTATSQLQKIVDRLQVYADLTADSTLEDQALQERRQMAADLSSKLEEATSWMKPEVLAIGETQLRSFLAKPELAAFRFQVEDILRLAPHTLSLEGERLLAAAAEPLSVPSILERVFAGSELPFKDATLSNGEVVHVDDQGYARHIHAPLSSDRKLIYEAYYGSFKAFEATLGESLSAYLLGTSFQAKARHYNSSLEAALMVPNIPQAVYATLTAEAAKGLPTLHRYYTLIAKVQHIAQPRLYDLAAPISTLTPRFTVPEMRDLALTALAPLGPSYVNMLSAATQAGWMDPLPRSGKFGGNLTDPGAYDVHPYLLLNLTPDYRGATTFAHEWGHAMHNVLAKSAQPYSTFSAPVFLQEVGSTCNEQLLITYMIQNAKTKEEKLFYLSQQAKVLSVVFFANSMWAAFEAQIHDLADKGGGLSGAHFSELYLTLMKQYYGPNIIVDPLYGIQWVRVTQLYDAFYLFQYCTSITAAVYFAQSILKGGVAERDTYLSVLKAGGSGYGYDVLREAHMDLAKPTPYQTIIGLFDDTISQMELLLT